MTHAAPRTETWIIDYLRSHQALPAPAGFSFERFMTEPSLLPNAIDQFGEFSPTDGQSEVPSVPGNLPRAAPRGEHLAWVLHDAEHVYVFMRSVDAPTLHGKSDMQGSITMLRLITPDIARVISCGIDHQGQTTLGASAYDLIVRQKPFEKRQIKVMVQRVMFEGAQWDGFALERSSLEGFIVEGRLRMSLSRVCLSSVEAVAWGSGVPWGIRSDEMVEVRLVESSTPSPWPIVRRVELVYDPASETGRFHLHMDSLYRPDEPQPHARELEAWKRYDTSDVAVRLNGRLEMTTAAHLVKSREFPIAEGDNHLRVTTIGGEALSCHFNKVSGNRLHVPDLGTPVAALDVPDLVRRIEDDSRRELSRIREELSRGPLHYKAWGHYLASSIGRAVHYLGIDRSLLEVVRHHADLCLTLTDTQGNFLGRHMPHMAASPKPWTGGAYDTGPAGELWVVAYRLFGDEKYLEASRRLVSCYRDYRVEFNQNYAGFALYHLSEHYRLTAEPLALEHATYIAEHCVLRGLLLEGYHAGHNYYTVYGGITVRGMGQLAQVLPEDHPLRPRLVDGLYRMVNQLARRIQPDGLFDSLDRHFLGMPLLVWGMMSCAPVMRLEDRGALDRMFVHMAKAPVEYYAGGTERMTRAFHRYAESELVRYLAMRPALLAGASIDSKTFW